MDIETNYKLKKKLEDEKENIEFEKKYDENEKIEEMRGNIKLVRFYDNKKDNIITMKMNCGNIKSILAVEQRAREKLYINYPYLKIFDNNVYTKHLKRKKPKHQENIEEMSDALTREQMDELLMWASANRYNKKIVLFDWDRTLSVIEGVLLTKSEKEDGSMISQVEDIRDKEQFYADMLIYYLSPYRANDIIRMFGALRLYDTEIFILTNNGGCFDSFDYRSLMNELGIDKKHLLCSGRSGSKHEYLIQTFGNCLLDPAGISELLKASIIRRT